MKFKQQHTYKQLLSPQSALIVLVILVIGVILYQIYLIYSIEQRQAKYRLIFPPNGTTLFQPSPTPSPVPRTVGPGLYVNDELGISIVIPDSFSGIETTEPDGWLRLVISSNNNRNLSMILVRIKKTAGPEGGTIEYACTPVLVHGTELKLINNKTVERCRYHSGDATSYDIRLQYPDTKTPFSLAVAYTFRDIPTSADFEVFDEVLSTLTFL